MKLYNRNVYSLYSLLLFVALIVSTPWWLLQMWRHGKYRSGWSERLGKVPDRLLRNPNEQTIWVHAVSVGEVQAVTPLIKALQKEWPGWRVVVSTTTDTGQRLARQRFGDLNVFYLPLDLPFAVRPYFEALRPRLLLLAESEFWPNLLRWAKLSGAHVAVVNARISDRSLPGYVRFRRLLRPMLHDIDLLLAQSQEDAIRLVSIGAPPERVQVSGNLKFELSQPVMSDIVAALAEAIARADCRPVIVAGSTLEGEESALIGMFREVQRQHSGATMVLAPRHPERFESVAALLQSSGIRFHRRSGWKKNHAIAGSVFLLDSIGELAALYRFADVAFVGGSLVPRGGHNIIEAAQFGVPILVGPHTENFRDIIAIFQRADALRVIDANSLLPTVLQLLAEPEQRKHLGERALQVMHSQQGATPKTVHELMHLLHASPVAAVPTESRA